MKFLRAFGRFWYDFVIGDDWKLAAAVLGSLLLVYLVMRLATVDDAVLTVIGAIAVVAAFATSLLIDTRRKSKD